MTQQVLVLISFLAVTGVLVLVFQMVFASTKNATDIAPARVNRYRGLWFLTLAGILGVVFFFTLPRSPYLLFVQERPEKSSLWRRSSLPLPCPMNRSTGKSPPPKLQAAPFCLPVLWWSSASPAGM